MRHAPDLSHLRRPGPPPDACLTIGGIFSIVCLAADGSERWRDTAKNGVVTVGLNSVLDVAFRAQAQLTAWFIGLIHSTNYSALALADTLASHAGWEESSAYSQATRPAWSPAAAAAGVAANAAAAAFSINAGSTTTLKGAFLASNSTKGGTTGTLFCTALFSGGDRDVINGDTLNLTYTLTAASG